MELAPDAPVHAAPPRFLCDEMLGRLARYLRAAGYDTLLARGGLADRVWLALAEREHRWFLTCDRAVAEHRNAPNVALVLPRGDIDLAAGTLARQRGVDWLHAPFTRCLIDNTPLGPAPPAVARAVPQDVSVGIAAAPRWCRDCGRAYWAGSHYVRMRARLAAWASLAAVAGP